ncbi:MAG: M23 family metallopeptidase, partial [Anaerolineales bacterium]|nr:M23 family metallopeptidase [Anaerolineales bacterium]
NASAAPAATPVVGTSVMPTAALNIGDVFPTVAPLSAEPVEASTVFRLAEPDTQVQERGRVTIEKYTVVKGDTVFGIAAKFNVKPDTILWGNAELADNINLLAPGKELNILPIDGALRVVQSGDTLEKIASIFHGNIDEILAFAGNDLDPSDPQIKLGQTIVIPGGWRDSVTWSLPTVGRNNTVSGSGRSSEPGACNGNYSGPTGSFTFVWPANNHYLSGWDYNPNTHPGLDIAAGLGAPIYASDNGVVVFSGWSNYGYGQLIILDHGNGWQTAYAHLSQINLGCGASIYQGQLIGLSGSTGNSSGPHLHFEMRNATYGRVNPWDFLR